MNKTSKKIISFISSLIFVMSASSFGIFATENINSEDINSDGIVNNMDLLVLKKALLQDNFLTDKDKSIYDLNLDGNVNILDLLQLKNTLLKQYEVNILSASMDSGFYNDNFEVSLYAPNGETIYYTLDGTIPTKDSNVYTNPIQITDCSDKTVKYTNLCFNSFSYCNGYNPIDKSTMGTILYAVLIDENGNITQELKRSYFVGIDVNNQYSNLPIISLIGNPDDLFSEQTGIFNEYNIFSSGQEWERPITFELFQNNGKLSFTQDVGVRIGGASSRMYPQLTLRLYAREEYGKKNMEYEFIPNNVTSSDDTVLVDSYKKLLLRSGGNDCINAKIRDVLSQSLVADRNFDTQANQPSIVFLNGEYWGVYSMQDVYDDNYIKTNYGVKKSEVILYDADGLNEGVDGDEQIFYDFNDFMHNTDFSLQDNYELAKEKVDIQNLIDYSCAEIFLGDYDGALGGNNYKLWRTRTIDNNNVYSDGKWRFMLYDCDMSLGFRYQSGNTLCEQYMNEIVNTTNQNYNQKFLKLTAIVSNLMKNKEFRENFITTFMDMYNNNFQSDRNIAILDDYIAKYRPVMEENYLRYNINKDTYNDFYGGTELILNSNTMTSIFDRDTDIIREYLTNAPNTLLNALKKYIVTGSEVSVNLTTNDNSMGSITINTITPDISSANGWTGTYFTDCPITITANANDGYEFVCWEGASNSTTSTIAIPLSKDTNIKAVFKSIE